MPGFNDAYCVAEIFKGGGGGAQKSYICIFVNCKAPSRGLGCSESERRTVIDIRDVREEGDTIKSLV